MVTYVQKRNGQKEEVRSATYASLALREVSPQLVASPCLLSPFISSFRCPLPPFLQVKMDKITTRIKKLTDGLNSECAFIIRRDGVWVSL